MGRGSHPVTVALAMVLVGVLAGCSGVTLRAPKVEFAPTPQGFRAAAAEVDITPEPGFPHFGHSTEGAKRGSGAWTRLKARTLAFEDARGERVAVVQLDLGAVSGMLHRRVALALEPERMGIGPHNLLVVASHTHGGPGGYFGSKFYNRFGAAKCGFYPKLLDSLVQKIADSVIAAFRGLEPAAVAAGQISVPGLTRNRSLEPWCLNFPSCHQAPYQNGLRPLVTVLRVDRAPKSGTKSPLAALVLLPVHATGVAADQTLYHGDLHGVAARFLSAQVSKDYGVGGPFVAAVGPGHEGDISPNWTVQGITESRRLGQAAATAAYGLFRSLINTRPIELRTSYEEALLPGTKTGAGTACDRPRVGVPTLAGAEDGRSFLLGHLGVHEGRRRKKPSGCHEVKVPAFGLLQRLLIQRRDLPRTVPIQVIDFGEELVLGALPGEATTETARRSELAIAKHRPRTRVRAVTGLANEYLSYFSTREEYGAQHYEGGSTLYGPATQAFFTEGLERLARHQAHDHGARRYWPGRAKQKPGDGPCPAWLPTRQQTEVRCDCGRISEVRFEWTTSKPTRNCPVPEAEVRCQGNPLRGAHDAIEDTDWVNFEIWVERKRHWTARWTRFPLEVPTVASCEVAVRTGGKKLGSSTFSDADCR